MSMPLYAAAKKLDTFVNFTNLLGKESLVSIN